MDIMLEDICLAWSKMDQVQYASDHLDLFKSYAEKLISKIKLTCVFVLQKQLKTKSKRRRMFL
jgi:glutamyl/glutaminyl-tRNA synthetase